MGAKLEKLKAAKVAHPTHKFSPEEENLIESLSDEEIATIISAKKRLGDKLLKKATDDEVHPNTLLL